MPIIGSASGVRGSAAPFLGLHQLAQKRLFIGMLTPNRRYLCSRWRRRNLLQKIDQELVNLQRLFFSHPVTGPLG